MANITVKMVQELRQTTGAGVLDCKQALEAAEGDLNTAAAQLREKGKAAAVKRSSREAKEGLIGSYVHAGNKVAALVELNCETDFVARTDQFQELAHDLAMQVVAARPLYLTKEDVPAEVVELKKTEFCAEMQDSGKPAQVIEQIIEGKLAKFFEEACLMEQPFIKDNTMTIMDLVHQKNALLGENVVVRQFVRFEVGG